MISKELLEAIYGEFVDLEIFQEENEIAIVSQGILCLSINIYELAYKCKEWARSTKDIWSGFDGIWYCSFNGIRFNADTEPEAIFKACQWILDNKKVTE